MVSLFNSGTEAIDFSDKTLSRGEAAVSISERDHCIGSPRGKRAAGGVCVAIGGL